MISFFEFNVVLLGAIRIASFSDKHRSNQQAPPLYDAQKEKLPTWYTDSSFSFQTE